MIRIFAFVAAAATCAFGAAPALAQMEGNESAEFMFYFDIAPTLMQRSAPANTGAIVASNPGGVPYMTGDQIEFGWDPGFEASFGVSVNPDGTLETRILYIRSQADQFQFNTPGNFIGTGFTGPGGTLFTMDYDTRLMSIEANWRQGLADRLTLLAGLRAMSVEDHFNSELNANVATGEYTYFNNRVGVQVGAELGLFDSASTFQLDIFGKVGVFSQQSQGGIDEFQGDNFIGDFQSDTQTNVAYAAEAGVEAGIKLTDNLEMNVGYQVLMLTGVALASDNAAMSLLNPSLLRDDIARGNLVYQGLKAGVSGSF